MDDDRERVKRVFTGDLLRTWATDAPLDPRNAVAITLDELCELADRPEETGGSEAEWLIYVPCIPINSIEARTMMAMMNCVEDGTMYAGYTNDELAVLPGGAQFSWTVVDPTDTSFQ